MIKKKTTFFMISEPVNFSRWFYLSEFDIRILICTCINNKIQIPKDHEVEHYGMD